MAALILFAVFGVYGHSPYGFDPQRGAIAAGLLLAICTMVRIIAGTIRVLRYLLRRRFWAWSADRP
jgi:hypothetical protein